MTKVSLKKKQYYLQQSSFIIDNELKVLNKVLLNI